MAPKKAQKMSLNEFLGDNTLGSWADEMDALPTAPAARSDEDRARPSDRRRDDFLSSHPDRASGHFHEDLPLPTEPPFTAFIGNLAFDLTEGELEDFFGGLQTNSVKIIKDRDEKPKGFGYIEFSELEGLKEALTKSGASLAGRTIRVSVAEPPKERSGFGGHSGFDDEAKFASNWRREGPLPDLPSSRDASRRRDGHQSMREPPPPSVSDTASDWRSSRAPARSSTTTSLDSESSFRRRGSGFKEGVPHGSAETEDSWTMGSRFKPTAPSGEGPGSRFGSMRGVVPPRDAPSPPDEGDWRRPRTLSRNSTSPSGSTPPTPQLARRKLELLPRSTSASATPSPLASPNPSTTSSAHHRSNPFGAAKPVDVSAKEMAAEERIEKERETTKERVSHHTMSRTSSHTASLRDYPTAHATPPASAVASPTTPPLEPHKSLPSAAGANVRPSFSFANVAAGKKEYANDNVDGDELQEIIEQTEEVKI
ncbi:hypothetical protein SCP_1302690 [Sparassis crispa]|uniref:RRM domain-containing protein n=1 Tax=Sparassis crispa TaxID=139825 RepID=A0A401H213_9APHY|nr:hypothetical protein SCP_1302690 [Sparassis crispa]GBE88454.1 hypothetical protein SCP_1302690 [Sparassis crispa]